MAEKGLHPDVIYVNGDIVTLDKAGTKAEAVAVLGDKIVSVGSAALIREMAGPGTRTVDLEGKTMVPGLIEPHNHFIMYGPTALAAVNLTSPPVGQIHNMKELTEALAKRASVTEKGGWVTGVGYDDTMIEEKKAPHPI